MFMGFSEKMEVRGAGSTLSTPVGAAGLVDRKQNVGLARLSPAFLEYARPAADGDVAIRFFIDSADRQRLVGEDLVLRPDCC